MAQSGYTPILIYASGTATNVPLAANLTSSSSGAELALNYADGKLFYKDNGGTVRVLATKGTGTIGGSDTQVQYNSGGALAGSVNMTFNGTSLTLGGNPTLSAGTANGVAYLNGSKVLTTGSALVFDGSNLGLGVTPSSWASTAKAFELYGGGSVYANASSNDLRIGCNVYINSAGTNTYKTTNAASFYYQADGTHYWYNAPSGTAGNAITFTQAMTLDASGRLLIGTTTASSMLTVAGTITSKAGGQGLSLSPSTTTNAAYMTATNGAGTSYIGIDDSAGNAFGAAYATFLIGGGARPLLLGTNGSERARIDSSGNLGLGVTPSAWSATYKALQVGGSVGLWGGASSELAILSSNAYLGGSGYARIIAGYATRYSQNVGTHTWSTAATSTAGSAITWTDVMTLDASGNLGIGTTSPSGRLHIATGGETTSRFDGSRGSADNLPVVTIPFWNVSNGVGDKQIATIGVLTGTSSNQTQKGQIYFSTSDGTLTERARIDSSGNLLVGTTSLIASERLIAQNAQGGSWVQTINNTAASLTGTGARGLFIQYTATPNSTSNAFWDCYDTGGATRRGGLMSNGGLANYSANNTNLSDRREKTDFAPADSYLSKICAIPVQTYKYIDQPDDEKTLGVVAQDVQEIAPELVTETNWGTEEEPKMRLSIYQTDLQYALMKCIQEQQAIIETLKARLDAANL